MSLTSRLRIFRLIVLIVPMLVGTMIAPAAAANYLPAVKTGDNWTFGDVNAFCSSFCPPNALGPFLGLRSAEARVMNVTGYNVGLNLTFTALNGFSGSSTQIANTQTGNSFLLIAGGLVQGDPIGNSTTSPRINGTIPRFYAGLTRQVNYVRSNAFGANSTIALYWDQQYGALLEVFEQFPFASQGIQGQGIVTLDLRVTSTNLWPATSPDFALAATEPSAAINVGQSASSNITLTSIHGLPGPVAVSAIVNPGIPSHPLATANPASVTFPPGTTKLSIITSISTLPGFYTVLVVANYTSISHFTTLYLNVTGPDFTISALPGYLNFQGPGTQTSTITLKSLQGFTGTVALSLPLPQQNAPQLSLASTSIPLTANGSVNTTLTVTVPNGTPPGFYSSNVAGSSGPLTHTTGISIYVQQQFPHIQLTASPSSLTLAEGTAGTSIITVTALGGFSGTLNVNAYQGSLADARLNVTSITLSPTVPSASAELAVAAGNEPGNLQAYVQASGPRVFSSITLNVTVTSPSPDFTIVASPGGFYEQTPGAALSTTLTLTSIKGFSDTINIAQQPDASSCAPMLEPANTTVALPANGSAGTMIGFIVPACARGGYHPAANLIAVGTNTPLHHNIYLSFYQTTNSTIPDFTLYQATSLPVVAPQGSAGNMTITVRSLNGFSGIVALTDLFSGIVSPGTVSLSPNGAANVTLIEPLYPQGFNYQAYSNVRATSGSISHTKYFVMNATSQGASPPFSIDSGSYNAQLPEGQQLAITFTITDSYLSNFAGTVDLGAFYDAQHLSVSLNQTRVSISPSHQAHVLMTISNASTSSVGTWTIVMTGRSGTSFKFTSVEVNMTSPILPNFSITLTPAFSSLQDGNFGKATVTLRSLNGFAGTVDLFSRYGTQFYAKTSHFLLSPGQTINVTIWVSPYYAYYNPNYSNYEVTGVSDTIVHTVVEYTTLTPRNDFSIVPSPSSLTFTSGSSSSTSIQINQNDVFTSPVTLTAGYPPELTIHLNTTTIIPSIQHAVNLTATGSVPGSYIVMITATSGQTVHSTLLVVNVNAPITPNFSLVAAPSSLTIPVGNHSATIITVQSLNGFAGTVFLSASFNYPVTLSRSNVTLTASSTSTVKLVVQIPSNTVAGNYQVTLTATNGTITHQIIIPVTVTGFDFTINTAQTLLTILTGTQGTTMITVGANGGSGTVNLAVATSTSLSCSLNPTSLTLNGTTQSSILSCTPSNPGTYAITVTGTGSGGIQHSITFTVFAPRIAYLPGLQTGNTETIKITSASLKSTLPPQYLQFIGFFQLLNTTDHVDILVTNVSGATVTYRQTWYYNNGTSPSIGLITVNLATGAYNATGTTPGGQSNVLLARGLQANDHTLENPYSPTLNMTATRTILGASRTVNFLNTTMTSSYAMLSGGNAWDQASGILIGANFNFSINIPSVGTAHGTFTASITQTNVWTTSSKPVISLATPTPNPADTSQQVNLSFTISSQTSVTALTVDWGDGTPTQTLTPTSTSATHTYTATGAQTHKTFTINVTATNSAGSSSATTAETVNDRPPAVSISSVSPNPANPNQSVMITFSATDPDGTVASVKVDWGDGTVHTLSGTATSDTWPYASAGPYTITVTATDNSGSTAKATISETVQAPHPTVKITSITPSPASIGATVYVYYTITSSTTVTGVTVDWGDGTTTHPAITATYSSHGYNSAGTFTIAVTATDSNSATGSDSMALIVSKTTATVAVSCTPGTIQTGGSTTCTITVTGSNPTGTVTLLSSSTTGSFNPTSPCTLAAGKCTVTYTDTSSASTTAVITANYPGDANNDHATSSFTVQLNPKTASTLVISCDKSSIQSGGTTTCTTTVTGSNPTGTVTVTTSDTAYGSFTPTNGQCTLNSGYCSVTYKDTSTSSTTAVLTASYPGDNQNKPTTNTFSLSIIGNTKTTSSLTFSCSTTSLQVGAFTTCTVTVHGAYPTGTVTVTTNSGTGAFTPSNGQCTLSSSACTIAYTDSASSNTTAILTASYPGDSQNTVSSNTVTLSIVKPSISIAVASSSTTISSGQASADQTSKTGVSVAITGSAASDGTPVGINTQHLSAPSPATGSISLSGASYYDVVVTGTTSGTAKVCINYSSASSSTTMQYWSGTAWTDATGVTISGTTVCGSIPVSALTGTNLAVGNAAQPAPSPPPPNNSNLLLIIIGVVVAVVIVIAAVAVIRRRGKRVAQPAT